MNEAPRIKSKTSAVGPMVDGQRLALLRMETRGTPPNMGYRFGAYAWEVAGEHHCKRAVREILPRVIDSSDGVTTWEGAYILGNW